MYFEIDGPHAAGTNWTHLEAVLHAADPFSRIALEPQHARFSIESGLTQGQVVQLLKVAGIPAHYLAHERGGSTCCGGCG